MLKPRGPSGNCQSSGKWKARAPTTSAQYAAQFTQPEALRKALVIELDGRVVGDLMVSAVHRCPRRWPVVAVTASAFGRQAARHLSCQSAARPQPSPSDSCCCSGWASGWASWPARRCSPTPPASVTTPPDRAVGKPSPRPRPPAQPPAWARTPPHPSSNTFRPPGGTVRYGVPACQPCGPGGGRRGLLRVCDTDRARNLRRIQQDGWSPGGFPPAHRWAGWRGRRCDRASRVVRRKCGGARQLRARCRCCQRQDCRRASSATRRRGPHRRRRFRRRRAERRRTRR